MHNTRHFIHWLLLLSLLSSPQIHAQGTNDAASCTFSDVTGEFLKDDLGAEPGSLSSQGNAKGFTDYADELPYYIYGLPYVAVLAQALLEEYLIKRMTDRIFTANGRPGIFMTETFKTLSEVVLRAVKQPALDRTQSYFQHFFGSAVHNNDPFVDQIEKVLGGSISEIEGRLGIEAQMARAVYERLLPILEAAFDLAASAYHDKRLEEAAELVTYAARFLSQLYPEMDSQDATTARLAKSSFAERVLISESFQDAVVAKIDNEDRSALELLNAWAIIDDAHFPDPETPGALDSFKSYAPYALGAAGYFIPALAKTFKISNFWVRVGINFMVNQFYYGITQPHSLMLLSETQLWMISHSITPRVDENENQGRTNALFVVQNRKVRTLLSAQSQTLRSHLIVMIRALVPQFREARLQILESSEKTAMAALVNAAIYLRAHFPEIHPDDPFVKDAAQTFFGKWNQPSATALTHLRTLLAKHDPEYGNPDVQSYYDELLKNWGLAINDRPSGEKILQRD